MSTYKILSDAEVRGRIDTSKQGALIGSMADMPPLSAESEGLVIRYMGATTGELVQYGTYMCVNTASGYKWQLVDRDYVSPEQLNEKIVVSASEPSTKQEGTIWFDTSV